MKCDELKRYTLDIDYDENVISVENDDGQYMDAYEVDAAIAELKQKLNEAQTELELWRDGSIISEAHQKELDGKRHSDYKRCLAMAKWCGDEAYIYKHGSEYDEDLAAWFGKWHKRWLELAEKFKPNNEVKNA